MTAYGNQDSAIAGGKVFGDSEVVTRLAGGIIDFGKPVVQYAGDSDKCYQYLLDKSVATFAADFVASNSIALTVNGLTATVAFDTDQATTKAALVAAVDALAGVTCTAGAGRAINIITEGAVCTASVVITGGVSQTTMSQVLSCSGSLFGVALRTQKLDGQYNAQDAVNVLREGEIWVLTNDTVVANTAAYLVAATGVWTDESSGNVSTGYYFRSSTSGAALARLEVIK